ncbi:hypothetical protein X801_06753 [Opisthorchis viverrini]|uniref:Carbamoyl phosphate synthase preATP-grasp domain-containing protein n=1 Tax=Opisthorchis viverrini TaxID=6198 RepID=A0A1S8WSQ7_OPIVI|nr:hypothetical protein X801_06753 [Opisthorchis viverrini]
MSLFSLGPIFLLPVTPDCVARIIEAERPDGILIGFGGQTGLTCGLALASPALNNKTDETITAPDDNDAPNLSILEQYDCRILGTPAATIEITENRQMFADAMHSIGEKVAPAAAATTVPASFHSCALSVIGLNIQSSSQERL